MTYIVFYSARREIRDIAFRWNASEQRSYVEFPDSIPDGVIRGLYGSWFGGVFKIANMALLSM